MSINRARKMAAARLGIELGKRYEALVNARGDDETVKAAVDLGSLFNDNIAFVIWALKNQGGLDPSAPEPIRRPVPAANDVPATPAIFIKH